MDPSELYALLFDMGVLEVDVWHDGVWNQVFREGGRNYNNTWHTSVIDLSVSCTYSFIPTQCMHN